MKERVIAMAAALALVLGMTTGVASAHECKDKGEHSAHGELASSCCKAKCLICRRKECVCFYLKKADELGLSEEQIAELKKLKREAKITKIRKRAEMEVIKVEVGALLDEKKPDLSAIDAKIDQCCKLKAAVKKACIHASVKAREVLTEEQLKTAKQLRKACDLSSAKQYHHKGEGHHHSEKH